MTISQPLHHHSVISSCTALTHFTLHLGGDTVGYSHMLKRSPTTPLFLFAAGMAAGWIAKQLFDTPEVQQRTRSLIMTARDLKDRLAESDEADRVKEIFGKVTQDATAMYQDAKANLMDELESLQISFDELDKRKYLGIVSDIVAGLRDERQLPEDQVKKLTRALNSDWQKISQDRSQSVTARQRKTEERDEE